MFLLFGSQADMRKFLEEVKGTAPGALTSMKSFGATVQLPGEQTERQVIDLAHRYGAKIQEWSVE